MTTLLIRNVAVRRRSGLDVRVGPDTILAVEPGLRPEPGEHVIDGQGGALVPGLHDHHLHLRAAVAARESVDVTAVTTPAEFDRVVAAAATAAAAAPGRHQAGSGSSAGMSRPPGRSAGPGWTRWPGRFRSGFSTEAAPCGS